MTKFNQWFFERAFGTAYGFCMVAEGLVRVLTLGIIKPSFALPCAKLGARLRFRFWCNK